MMTAWTGALVHGFEFSASVMCCQPSHMPQTRSREVQILCSREDPLSIREMFCLCCFFLYSKRKPIIYHKKRPSLLFSFYAAGILWSHCVGPWRTVPRMIPGRSRKPLLEIHLFSWLLPQNSPPGTVFSRQEDGWPEVFPHLCRAGFLKPIQSWWLSLANKGTAASTEAHSPSPLQVTSKKGIPHSRSREGEDSDQQLKKRLLKLPTQTASQLPL